MLSLAMNVRELDISETDQVSGAGAREWVGAAGATAGAAVGALFGMPWLTGPSSGAAAMAYYDWVNSHPQEAAAASEARNYGPSR